MPNEKRTNNLINEASPYLLQHAHNPVDWYPWGQEAFEKAKAEDKPIFLSIGYSTCHWCHVMAHESFEDEDVASVLNSSFVSIKVDREQRPDIDEVYMSVCQAVTGSGGWPLSIFMTADKKPFFAGTYFPKDTGYGRIGFIELCANILRVWKTDRQTLLKSSNQIINLFNKTNAEQKSSVDTTVLIDDGYNYLKSSFDKHSGGFSDSPKFPTAHNILFLLKYYKAKNEPFALHMAQNTLMHMYRGGIFDHIGGGFSRYSTDSVWLVPHFEKMLYDNALLLLAYSEAYSLTKDHKYSAIIDKICTYILRDMQSQSGGFYSAEDADSEGVEGKFYVFDYSELESKLDFKELRYLEENFGVSKKGNFEGKNILHKTTDADDSKADAILKKLYDIRGGRVRPFLDTKISTSWNGLMIEALSRAAQVMSSDSYLQSAKKAADFILEQMKQDEELSGIYKEGAEPTRAFLSDYANFANGLLSLYSATLEIVYLQTAIDIAHRMIDLFWDDDAQRFYMASADGQELFYRPKDEYDGAMPSGNSCALKCLSRLVALTGDEGIKKVLNAAVSVFGATAQSNPGAYVHYLSVLLSRTYSKRQIVISARKDSEQAITSYKRISREFFPFSTLIYYDGLQTSKETFSEFSGYDTNIPFAAYVCENFACKSPVYSPEELMELLDILS